MNRYEKVTADTSKKSFKGSEEKTESASNIAARGFSKTVLWLVFFVSVFIVRGLVIRDTWGWFVMPFHPHIPELNIVWAIGIGVFCSALAPVTNNIKPNKSTDTEESQFKGFILQFSQAFIGWIITYTIAWIVHMFM